MTKKLALVVHGIGEQREGETVFNLVGGLTGSSAAQIQTERRELIEREKDGKGELFPCHTVRVKSGSDETVFAEVFWADLSGGQGGALRNAYELIKLSLGLGHVVRRNVRTFAGNGYRTKLAETIVHILHGPIAAINAILIAGVILNSISFFGERPLVVGWLVALAAIGAGALGRKLATDRHYYRIFSSWLLGLGVGLVVLSLLTMLSDHDGSYPAFGFVEACSPEMGQSCLLPWLALPFVVILNCAALAAILGTMILISIEAWSGRGGPKDRHKIYDATLALMIVMWLTIASVVWSSLFPALHATASANEGQSAILNLVSSSTMLMGVLFVGLFVISGTVLLVLRQIKRWSAKYPNVDDKTKPRLMVNPLVQYALMSAIAVLAIVGGEIVWSRLTGKMSFFQVYVDELYFIGVIGAFILAALYSTFSELVGHGIAVIKDIIAYLKQEPLIVKIDGQKKEKWLEPLRDRMKTRLEVVARVLNAGENPEEIVIVSHSLGTMIATDGLADEKIWPHLVTAKGRKPDLVTMGSPYSHLFNHHFGGFEEPKIFETRVGRWLNIYRADDFVGTTVDIQDADWFKNRRVGPRGHTGYWSDVEVTPILRDEIFKELPEPLRKAA